MFYIFLCLTFLVYSSADPLVVLTTVVLTTFTSTLRSLATAVEPSTIFLREEFPFYCIILVNAV